MRASHQSAWLDRKAERERTMVLWGYSRVSVRTLLKFGRCAEQLIARKWTCWNFRSRAPHGLAPHRPPTILQRACSTTPIKSQADKRNPIRGLFHLPAHSVGPTKEESGVTNHYSFTPSRGNVQPVSYSCCCSPWRCEFPAHSRRAAAAWI